MYYLLLKEEDHPVLILYMYFQISNYKIQINYSNISEKIKYSEFSVTRR